MLKLKVYR